MVSLISDDNFNSFLQRTVFLQFALRQRIAEAPSHAMIQPSARAFDIRHELRPGDLGMVIHLHGVHYAREYGLDTTFEPYVAKPLADFVLSGAGRLWIAEEDGRVVGSIAVVDADDGVGQLQVVSADAGGPRHRSRPAHARDGADLLPGARHAPASSYGASRSSTTRCRLYERAGFKITETNTTLLWGAERTEVRMDLEMGSR